ncbi:mRNA-decapping enzyme subunit 2 [Coelomomyces lativittatus]|nr:mRNA-decapping enzyme subunit 2 [Coelomomyces lativittatus]
MATFKDMKLKEVIDDLAARFIINVPNAELASIERICFQIEQAHWYYQDFVQIENPLLPSITLKSFCAQNKYFFFFFPPALFISSIFILLFFHVHFYFL